jgi:hypothetical protein
MGIVERGLSWTIVQMDIGFCLLKIFQQDCITLHVLFARGIAICILHRFRFMPEKMLILLTLVNSEGLN